MRAGLFTSWILGAVPAAMPAAAQVPQVAPPFTRHQLDASFTCEGIQAGDIDRDGVADVVAGPYWYRGPRHDPGTRLAIYQPQTFPPATGYSDNFHTFLHDLNADGWLDVLVIGFPGTNARWYENPRGSFGSAWGQHVAVDAVLNESPAFEDLTGDGRPELVFQTVVSASTTAFVYAEPDPANPTSRWRVTVLSTPLDILSYGVFTHGLGVGDINGDGRKDVIEKGGWWEQPFVPGVPWARHRVAFSLFGAAGGGGQMFAYDVDGDGDNDVIVSQAAHGFGLSWYEQVRDPRADMFEVPFVERRIMDQTSVPHFAEAHALQLADIDGDGLLDLITGKRWWSHGPQGDPDPTTPPVLYWSRLTRPAAGPRFVPHLIDSDSGVGTQFVVTDLDRNNRVDVLVANKRGAFVFLQQ
jgi:hypothetical protein